MTLRSGERFELWCRAACVAAGAGKNQPIFMIEKGARGVILKPAPKHLEGCALVEFTPPPIGAGGSRFFVRYDDILLIDPPITSPA